MREFSDYEKFIISAYLVNGAGITGMLSSDFLEKGKLHITVSPGKQHRFEYFSSEHPVELARDELVNLIELLLYLENEKLLRMYPPLTTNLDDFSETVSFTFGDSWSAQSHIFLLHKKSKYIGNFLKERRDYTFKATEPLRQLAGNNFRSAEEIRHNQILTQARRANYITLGIAVLTVLIGFTGIIIQNSTEVDQLEVDKAMLFVEKENHLRDSVIFADIEADIQSIKMELNSSQADQAKMRIKLDSIIHVLKVIASKRKPKGKSF